MSSISTDSLPYFDPAVDRRVALITGGNSGIGYYTVLQLYLHGYVVYIAGRSRSRVLKSIKELKEKANTITKDYEIQNANTNLTSPKRCLGELVYLEIDLSSLSSVIAAVDTFSNMELKLNLLINNAGAMAVPYALTRDNFEIQLQTNFVSPFLLTTKLLPLLERTADLYPSTEPPRVVYLSSIGHKFAIRFFSLNTSFNYRPNLLFTWLRYGMAKTAGIHFMKMLALRNPKILCMLVHPGFVMNTNLFTYWTRLPIIGILFWCFFQIFGYFLGVSNDEGSDAIIKCCLEPKLSLENDNGKYFVTGGIEAEPSKVASNMDYAARTWIWTVHELSERGITIPN